VRGARHRYDFTTESVCEQYCCGTCVYVNDTWACGGDDGDDDGAIEAGPPSPAPTPAIGMGGVGELGTVGPTPAPTALTVSIEDLCDGG
jgi:hypothetical protein